MSITLSHDMAAMVKANVASGEYATESEMSVSVEGQRLVLEPMKPARPKYTIDELIAKCDLSAPYPDEAREWIDAPPVGRELL